MATSKVDTGIYDALNDNYGSFQLELPNGLLYRIIESTTNNLRGVHTALSKSKGVFVINDLGDVLINVYLNDGLYVVELHEIILSDVEFKGVNISALLKFKKSILFKNVSLDECVNFVEKNYDF